MEENVKKKKAVLITAIASLLIVLVISLVTLAYWQITRKQTNRNVAGTACLNITFTNENNDINLQNIWPMTDSEGSGTEPYTFTITNTCSDPVNYMVALESITDTENYITDYLDYNYVKVKLDNGNPSIYNNLTSLTNDTPNDYEVRATKELAHHTLTGGTSVTHSLRIWLDIDTPYENEDHTLNSDKYFFGKIKVIAGQGIEGDPVPKLKVLSLEGEPDATLNNISVGDRVGFETEEFYVIGIDGNNVKLLSRYLLNVGDYVNPNGTEGLQYDKLGRTRTAVNDSSSATAYFYNTGLKYGSVRFTSNYYWKSKNTYVSPYTNNSFVYNDTTKISTFVNGYAQTLQTMGLSVTNGTLLSIQEIGELCNTEITTAGNYSSQCPNYLFETQYWLGSTFSVSALWCAFPDGGLRYDYYDGGYGVRPVINITLS